MICKSYCSIVLNERRLPDPSFPPLRQGTIQSLSRSSASIPAERERQVHKKYELILYNLYYLFHHSLLAPTWTQDCLLGLYWTGLTLLNGFFSFLVIFFFFFFNLSCAVDEAGLTASFRAHVNIASLLTYLLTCPSSYCLLRANVCSV